MGVVVETWRAFNGDYGRLTQGQVFRRGMLWGLVVAGASSALGQMFVRWLA